MLGERLVELRKKKKLTQQDIANRLHITRSTYAQYEIGRRVPEYATLEKLADFFEVSIDYLVGREQLTTNDQAMNDVLEKYDRLPQHKKKLVDDIIRELLDEGS